MHYLNFLSSPVVQALGQAIVYSLGQGIIIFICLRVVLKCMPHATSRFKYAISYIAHLSMLAWFVISFLQRLPAHAYALDYVQSNQGRLPEQDIFDGSVFTVFNGPSYSFLQNSLPWIVAFYFAGLVWCGLRLALSYMHTITLRRKEHISFDPFWQARIKTLSHVMGLRKRVYPYLSRHTVTPLMIGFFKPLILLPMTAFTHLSPQQIEALLLHELAHIRRNDYLLNIIQSVTDIVLFFNPFAGWISKHIRHQREQSCDEMVLQVTEPYSYARALLALEESAQCHHRLAMAATDKRSYLLHRIKNIMEMKSKHTNRRQKLIAVTIVMSTIVSLAWISPKDNGKTHVAKKEGIKKNVSYVKPVVGMDTVPVLRSMDTGGRDITPPLPPTPPGYLPEAPKPPKPPAPHMMPLPPLPPLPSLPDTVPLPEEHSVFNFKQFDSVFSQKLGAYFNSPEWKKQMQEIEKSTGAVQRYFQSEQWKQQVENMQKSNEALKKQVEEIRKNAIKLQKEYFDSPEWKKQIEEIKKNSDDLKHYFDSDEWKKQQKEMMDRSDALKNYFNGPKGKEN
ncbi:MAG: M48 family metalloprotease [Chitinophagaceae bacterium]|nr:M48 family metalloprotease [Chitinophagaceae bacterium]